MKIPVRSFIIRFSNCGNSVRQIASTYIHTDVYYNYCSSIESEFVIVKKNVRIDYYSEQ